MDEKDDVKKVLQPEEMAERAKGQQLYEMTQTPGFAILKEKLDGLSFHSWVDPREVEDKRAWEWRELNAFHASNNAKELVEWIQESINRAEYLEKKRRGEVGTRSLTIK